MIARRQGRGDADVHKRTSRSR